MAVELTDANFQEKVLNNEGVSVVDFWAEWCGPCRMVGPIVEQIAKEYEGRVLVGKVDVDNNPEVSSRYQIRSIPTILFMKNGEIVDKQIGAANKSALVNKLEAHLTTKTA